MKKVGFTGIKSRRGQREGISHFPDAMHLWMRAE